MYNVTNIMDDERKLVAYDEVFILQPGETVTAKRIPLCILNGCKGIFRIEKLN